MPLKMLSAVQTTSSTRRALLRQSGVLAGLAGLTAATAARAEDRPLGANDRIGIGIIGCGGRGRDHLNILKTMKDAGAKVEIVAVSDTYRPRMAKQAEALKARAYFDHRELLADKSVDLVCIATPDHIHGYQVIDAVRAGKDVYCEKPVTHWRQYELTKRMVAEVKKSGRIFQLGSQGMSNTAWHQAKKLIQEGIIGQPIHAECGYFRVGDWGEAGMPIDDPNVTPGEDLNWDAFLGDANKRPFDVSRYFRWRLYQDYSGGPATDLYPHSFTPVVYMLGVKMPSTVVGLSSISRYHACKEREVPDTANILAEYPEKTTVAILGTQGNNFPGEPELGSVGRAPTLRGWEGTISFDNQSIIFTPAEGSKRQRNRWPIEHGEDVRLHWQNLLDCCRTRTQPASPVDLAWHTQTVLQMGILSARAGKAAKFDKETESVIV
ncbi:MAG: Gfo/Idh/MocA family oxidoreductase [Phycisphaerae bacterium]|nr:Gfo/Idh/MocA family oxidoreductase [Phycisphaerae bacterium]